MTVIYHDEDGDLGALAGKRVGVIGYGNMGRPVALNLRDSGVSVLVSEPRPEKQAEAISEGFALTEIDDLARTSDILMPLLRDEAMPKIYLEHVSPHLRRGRSARRCASATSLARASPASWPSRRMPAVRCGGSCWRWRKRWAR